MAVENLYSYLEYLNLAIDQLEEAVIAGEQATKNAEQQLAVTDAELVAARREIDRLNAQLHMNAQQAEAEVEKIQNQASASAKQKAAPPTEADLFGGWTQTPAKSPAKASVANDQNALILAKKLDSTIDKVQRLIGQGR